MRRGWAGRRHQPVSCGKDEIYSESHRRSDVGSVADVLGQGAAVKRVLVVDDDPLDCSAIRVWLEERGFSVFVADGGETGLGALDSSTFDLMIVDIFMPHMHGFESVRVFHQRAPAGPLIAIIRLRLRRTANTSAGFSEYGPKPRCDALSTQAFHALDVAERHRRMPARI
jgi:CheY-like chemotaxis protein